MIKLEKYTAQKNFIICYVLNDDENVIGFAVCDRNKERYTNHLFTKASYAIEYGNQLMECKGLLNDQRNAKSKSK